MNLLDIPTKPQTEELCKPCKIRPNVGPFRPIKMDPETGPKPKA